MHPSSGILLLPFSSAVNVIEYFLPQSRCSKRTNGAHRGAEGRSHWHCRSNFPAPGPDDMTTFEPPPLDVQVVLNNILAPRRQHSFKHIEIYSGLRGHEVVDENGEDDRLPESAADEADAEASRPNMRSIRISTKQSNKSATLMTMPGTRKLSSAYARSVQVLAKATKTLPTANRSENQSAVRFLAGDEQPAMAIGRDDGDPGMKYLTLLDDRPAPIPPVTWEGIRSDLGAEARQNASLAKRFVDKGQVDASQRHAGQELSLQRSDRRASSTRAAKVEEKGTRRKVDQTAEGQDGLRWSALNQQRAETYNVHTCTWQQLPNHLPRSVNGFCRRTGGIGREPLYYEETLQHMILRTTRQDHGLSAAMIAAVAAVPPKRRTRSILCILV